MKSVFAFIFLASVTTTVLAQKIELKKNIVLVDGVEQLSRDNCPIAVEKTKCIISSVKTNMPLFSIFIIHYVEINKPIMDISFFDFEGKCRSTMTVRDLYYNLFKIGVIDSNGKVDKEKAMGFIRLFNEEKDTR